MRRESKIIWLLAAAIAASFGPHAVLAAQTTITVKNIQDQKSNKLVQASAPGCAGFNLGELTEILPLEGGWDQARGIVELRYQGRWCRFMPGYRRVLLMNQYVILSESPCLAKDQILVPFDFITGVLVPLFGGNLVWDDVSAAVVFQPFVARVSTEMETGQQHIIVVDPGHGGADSGIGSEDRPEKAIMLETAHFIQTLLQDTSSCGVRLTRDTDYSLSWQQRAAQGNYGGVSFYLSLHGYNGGEHPELRIWRTLPAIGEHEKEVVDELLRWGEKVKGAPEIEQGFIVQMARAVQTTFPNWSVAAYDTPILQLEYVSAPALLIEVPLNAPELTNQTGIQKLSSALASALRLWCEKP